MYNFHFNNYSIYAANQITIRLKDPKFQLEDLLNEENLIETIKSNPNLLSS